MESDKQQTVDCQPSIADCHDRQLSHYHFHVSSIKSSRCPVRTMNDNIGDVEPLVTAQLTELFLLLCREGSAIACQGNSIAHIVEEDNTETGDGKRNVEQAVVNSRMDARC